MVDNFGSCYKGVCTGECPGWCAYNLMDFDFLDDIDRKRTPYDCDPSAITVRDFFSNNTIFDPNDPTCPGCNGPQQINWYKISLHETNATSTTCTTYPTYTTIVVLVV